MDRQSDLVFERDERSVIGFASLNRASTDAIGALMKWQATAPGRSFNEITDGDEMYRARLIWRSDDPAAGDDLDDCCNRVGVKRSRTVEE